MSDATFVAYIDEAGDEGFKFGKGSSEWFVLGAVVLRCLGELEEVRLVDEVRARINQGRKPEYYHPTKKPLHFCDLKHDVRKFYASRIAKASLQSVVIATQKPALISNVSAENREPEILTWKQWLYHVATICLIERISWYCRDHLRPDDMGDGSIDLVFSNRATMDYAALQNTIAIATADVGRYNGHPGIIRPDQVGSMTHGRRMGLQIADAVTSSHYQWLEPSQDGFTEDGYVRLLKPCLFSREGKILGYGIHLLSALPETAEIIAEDIARWR